MIARLVILISGCLTVTFAPLKHQIKPKMQTCTGAQNFGAGGRIVGAGAKPAKKNSWPWLVRVEMRSSRGGQFSMCSGTIISDDIILPGKIGIMKSGTNQNTSGLIP